MHQRGREQTAHRSGWRGRRTSW
uniref:Uncharacterized protein n=1 Tax=Arundo donax TaxID=35708 RepID=A0A0A9AK16_ARUDO